VQYAIAATILAREHTCRRDEPRHRRACGTSRLLRDESSSEEEMSQPLTKAPRPAGRAEEGDQKMQIPVRAFKCELFLFCW
jgi:hypothetical protein